MIAKDSLDYKKAQKVANVISDLANTSKISSGYFDLNFERLSNILSQIKKLNCFAAKVAETISGQLTPYNYYVAKISSKQSWILACAIVENGLESCTKELPVSMS